MSLPSFENAETIAVDLGDKSYPIHIGRGLLADIAAFLPMDLAGRTLFILTDENVAHPHAQAVFNALKSAGAHDVQMMALPAGEQTKRFDMLEKVLSWMLDHGVNRSSVLFAVGGGVIGDLGGFAAATIMRGIDFIQVPTTLLAQVDSSVGGKTGINMPQGKNLVGAFYQPRAVICDLDTLATLPRRQMLAGYAEIVKYGLISDPEFFIWLEETGAKIMALDTQTLMKAVGTSCRKKAGIVERDEKEKGMRALLNLGHTFGHALEAVAGYDGRLLHGEAVSIGMSLAFQLSERLAICPSADVSRVIRHLSEVGLPTDIEQVSPPLTADVDDIMLAMAHDKKSAKGQLIFILAEGIGKASVHADVPLDEARYVVKRSLGKV